MQTFVIPVIIVVSAAMSCAPQKPTQSPESRSRDESVPVAVINSEEISYHEYQERLGSLPSPLSTRVSSMTERQVHLNELAQFEVLADAAERDGLADRAIVRNEIDETIIEELLAYTLRSKKPDEESLKEVWQREKHRFFVPETRRGGVIYCAAKEPCEDFASQIDKVVRPTDRVDLFQAIAKERSIDRKTGRLQGDMGWFSENTKNEALLTALFKLTAPGQLAGPLQIGNRWAIVLFHEARDKKQLSYEKSRKQIRKEVIDRLRSESRQNLLDQLRSTAQIEIEESQVARLKPPSPESAVEN
jgi:hypothetical protein